MIGLAYLLAAVVAGYLAYLSYGDDLKYFINSFRGVSKED
jgi:uncharacterized membrane protein YbhN (UPF0104 family)